MRASPFRQASATGLSRPDATDRSRTRTAARFGAVVEGGTVDVRTVVDVVGAGLVGGDCEGFVLDDFPLLSLHAASSSDAQTPTTIK
jgi:hypothetical protein